MDAGIVEVDEAPSRVPYLQRTRSNTTTRPLEVSVTRSATAAGAARASRTGMSSFKNHSSKASALFIPCGGSKS